MRAPVSEGDFQAQVLELTRLSGWRCYHTFDSRRSAPGFPDLVLVRPPVVLFAELKAEVGKFTSGQLVWLSGVEACPGMAVRLWRPGNWPEVERVLAMRGVA